MNITQKGEKVKVDWMFLLFLAGATYVKLYVKLAVVLLYAGYLLVKRFEFKSLERIHAFYLIMPFIGLLGAVAHNSFADSNYMSAMVFGFIYWLLAAGVSYLLYVTVINLDRAIIQKTLKMFFAFNALISFGELFVMIIESGYLVPYWHWGPNMYYGGATGDHIFGLTGNISVTNAMISALGGLYFLFNKELRWSLLCFFVSLMCTSNLTLVFSVVMLVGVLFLAKEKVVRKYAFYTILFSAIVYPILTFDNIEYAGTIYGEDIKGREYTEEELLTINRIRGLEWKEEEEELFEVDAETFEDKSRNFYHVKLKDSARVTFKNDFKYLGYNKKLARDERTDLLQQQSIKDAMNEWYKEQYGELPLTTFHKPIKLYTGMQTLKYMSESPRNALVGAGIGNFSSKQAIKTTGLGLQGSYPNDMLYISNDFMVYHLYTLLYVLSLPVSEHSIINMPNSVYNQVGGEYGLIGVILFVLLYLGYFWKNRKGMKYGLYILTFTLMCFGFEYWFEMISLTVIFELIMFLNIYKPKNVE